MPGKTTLQMIGNWDKEIGVSLQNALAVSRDVIGDTGEKACRRAIVEMAKAAKALTPKAKKNRKVLDDPMFGPYVENYRQGNHRAQKLFRWNFGDGPNQIHGTWEDAKKIGNQGLAKRSWLWGLSKIGGKADSAPIRGTSRLRTIRGETVNGYIKENMLSYIQRAMPHGWERMVELKAGNRIMGFARNKLMRKWSREVGAGKKATLSNRGIADYFLKGAA